jgi:hypothetical protein
VISQSPDVAAPQLADLLDRAGHGRREVQPHAGRQVLAVGHADLVDGDGAPQLAPDRLGDDGRGPPTRLLTAQPAGHGGLVVPQVQAVFGAAHVDPARQSGV